MRRCEIAPCLAGIRRGGRYKVIGERAVEVRWPLPPPEGELLLAANLAPVARQGFAPAAGRIIWREGDARENGGFGPFAVRWSLEPAPIPPLL